MCMLRSDIEGNERWWEMSKGCRRPREERDLIRTIVSSISELESNLSNNRLKRRKRGEQRGCAWDGVRV